MASYSTMHKKNAPVRSDPEIGQVLGGLHYSAVSKAAARLEKELSKDKDLAKIVDRLVSNVKS